MSRTFARFAAHATGCREPCGSRPLSRADDLLLLLERWVERGWLRALDKAFVAFLA
jgi:exodeoxyribonuclease V alpha subunit